MEIWWPKRYTGAQGDANPEVSEQVARSRNWKRANQRERIRNKTIPRQ